MKAILSPIFSRIHRLFNSHSSFFHQPVEVLSGVRKQVDLLLSIRGYETHQRSIYLKAFDYMRDNPQDFDGATMTEDLPDIEGLELAAMLHDYLYVEFNASGSFKYSWMADKLMRSEMRRMGKSSWNTGARFVLLILKAPFFVPYTYIFKNRRMSDRNKFGLEHIYRSLTKAWPRPWYQEFKGEITWSIIILSLILYIIF